MRAVAIAIALIATGCASWDTGNQARRSAAAVLECEESFVQITQLGAYRYRADGCGRSATLACTASQLEPHCLRESDELAAVPPPPQSGPSEAPNAASGAVEAAIRERLDARATDILGCVGRDRVGVRVAWTADGTPDVSLQGELRSSAEERCVRDLLAGARVPAEGQSGVVVHLVHAP